MMFYVQASLREDMLAMEVQAESRDEAIEKARAYWKHHGFDWPLDSWMANSSEHVAKTGGEDLLGRPPVHSGWRLTVCFPETFVPTTTYYGRLDDHIRQKDLRERLRKAR